MKRILCFALVLVFLMSLTAFAEDKAAPEIRAEYAAVYNTNNKKFLFEKDANTIIYPASFAKIMTGLLACEYYEEKGTDFDVIVSQTALESVVGNKIGLKAGESVSFYDLIAATLVGGGNDAAYVIAETVGGSVDEFVNMMNAKALQLGLEHTNYANPGGYHSPYMYTTLRDQALVCASAANNELFIEISSMVSYEMPPTDISKKRTFTNQNLLLDPNHWLRHYIKGASGLNVGMTEQAGWCLATVYNDNGAVNVVLISGGTVDSAKYDFHYFDDAKTLIDFTKASHSYITLLESGRTFHEAYVSLGKDKDSVILETDGEIIALLPEDADIEHDVEITYSLSAENLEAPVKEGDVFGVASAFYKGELVGEVNLVANTSVKRSFSLFVFNRISGFFKNPVVSALISFLFSLAFAAAVLAFMYVMVTRRKQQMQKHRRIVQGVHHARRDLNKNKDS